MSYQYILSGVLLQTFSQLVSSLSPGSILSALGQSSCASTLCTDHLTPQVCRYRLGFWDTDGGRDEPVCRALSPKRCGGEGKGRMQNWLEEGMGPELIPGRALGLTWPRGHLELC